MGTLKPNAEEVVSAGIGSGGPAIKVTKGGFSDFSLLVPVNVSKLSAKKDGPVVTPDTLKPIKKMVSTGIRSGRPIVGIVEDGSFNSFF